MSIKTIEEILQTASARLYPEELGKAKVELNSKNSDGDTPLHIFIWGDETENALLLINNGADVNAIGHMGETPLHIALRNNNLEVVKALIKAKADITIISEFGKSSVDLANEKGIKLIHNF